MAFLDYQSIYLIHFTNQLVDNFEFVKAILVDIGAVISWTAVTSAAFVATYAGVRGIKLWKDQLYGTSEFSISTKTIECALEYIDQMKEVSIVKLKDRELGRFDTDQIRRDFNLGYNHLRAQATNARLERLLEARTKLSKVSYRLGAVIDPRLQNTIVALTGKSNDMFDAQEGINNMIHVAITGSFEKEFKGEFLKQIEEEFEKIIGDKGKVAVREASGIVADLFLALKEFLPEKMRKNVLDSVEARKMSAPPTYRQVTEPEDDSQQKQS